MTARYARGAAPRKNAEWFVTVLQDDDHPESYRVLKTKRFAGSLRGAERYAQELFLQAKVANRGLWPVWTEVSRWDDLYFVSSHGQVPEERRVYLREIHLPERMRR